MPAEDDTEGPAAEPSARRGIHAGRSLAVGWVLGLALLSAAPFLLVRALSARYALPPAEYAWILPPYPEDPLAYGAWVEQAASGALVFRVLYAAIPHEPVVFQPFFLLTGWLAAGTGLHANPALLVAKTLAVAAFGVVFLRLCAALGLSTRQRVLAAALVSVSSGLGAFVAPFEPASVDLWMPEVNTLWSLVWNPVFAVALGLIAGEALLLVRYVREGGQGRLAAAGGLVALLAFVHPYDVPVAGLLGLAAIALRGERPVRAALAFGLPCLPAVALQLYLAQTHPVLSRHGGVAMESPPPHAYLLGLGLPLALAAVGALSDRRPAGRAGALLVLWIAIVALAVYAPVAIQRRMAMGVHLPVCLLGAAGLDAIMHRLAPRRRGLGVALAVLVLGLTTATHVYNARSLDAQMRGDPGWYFLAPGVSEALDVLARDVGPGSVVLAHPVLSSHVPGRTGAAVLMGHWAQSVDTERTAEWLRAVFAPRDAPPDPGHARALRERGVTWILVDSRMLAQWLGGRLPPWLLSHYRIVLRNDHAVLLRSRAADAGRR